MRTQWTTEQKPRVEANLRAAGIDLKSEAAKTILRFERRINTMIIQTDNGSSWEAICNSNANLDANNALFELNGWSQSLHGCSEAKFGTEWIAYCKTINACPEANVGDWLA